MYLRLLSVILIYWVASLRCEGYRTSIYSINPSGWTSGHVRETPNRQIFIYFIVHICLHVGIMGKCRRDLVSSDGSIDTCLSCQGMYIKSQVPLRPSPPFPLSPSLCPPCLPSPITQKFHDLLSILLAHPRRILSLPASPPLSNL